MNRPLIRLPLRTTATAPVRKWLKWGLAAARLLALAWIARLVEVEIETSRLQARYLSELTRDIGFSVEPGTSHTIHFPPGRPGSLRQPLGVCVASVHPAAVIAARF